LDQIAQIIGFAIASGSTVDHHIMEMEQMMERLLAKFYAKMDASTKAMLEEMDEIKEDMNANRKLTKKI
jgi:hypothetical protein